MQIAKLEYALGGAIVFDGYPLPPLVLMPNKTEEEARALATYYGDDMRWMFYHGSEDFIFDKNATYDEVTAIWEVLDVNKTLKIFHIECGMNHDVSKNGTAMMIEFINGKNSDDSQEYCPPSKNGMIWIIISVSVVLACCLVCCYFIRSRKDSTTF
jgi:hypothetical protein